MHAVVGHVCREDRARCAAALALAGHAETSTRPLHAGVTSCSRRQYYFHTRHDKTPLTVQTNARIWYTGNKESPLASDAK